MTLQYLLFWGMESGLLLLRERKRSVWTRVRAAAVPLSCVLAGKALATGFARRVTSQVLVTFAVGYFAFGVTIDGSEIGFVLLAVLAGVRALPRRRGCWSRRSAARRPARGA